LKQRLSIASALLSNPPVLILDEPTNGLDPEGIAEVRDLIKDIASKGKTIIMASHLLDEVQKVCTHFCILRKGEKLHEGSVDDILGETNVVEIKAEDMKILSTNIESYSGMEKVSTENGSIFVSLKDGHSSEDLNKFCFDRGISLKKLLQHSKSLEQEFLKILKEND
jgi:ABC-2 type transport system ATP-binding protein